jgi:PAS domain S-box-containing protein
MNTSSPAAPDSQPRQIARRTVDAAPAPALVICADSVHANAAAAQWLARVDRSWPAVAGDLPAAHALTRELRQRAQRAADTLASVPLRLGPLQTHTLTAQDVGTPGAPVLVAWLQPNEPAPTDLDLMRERLAAATGVAHVGLFERDLTTGEGSWDPVCFELFGVDPSRGVPDPLAGLQHIDPRDRERVQLGIRRLNEAPAGSEFVIEFRVMLAGSGVRHLESRSRVVPGRDSLGRRAVGVLLDVSDRFRADEMRHELTQRLDQVAEAGRVGLWLFNPVTRVSEWNAQMYTLSGRDPDAGPMTLDEALSCVHPDDRQTTAATALIEQGLPVQARVRLLQPDGTLRWVFVRASRIGGDSPHLAAAIVDITDLQVAEARNQQLNERLSLAVASAGIGIWDLDTVSGKSTWNEQLYTLMLRSPEEPALDMCAWSQHLHPDDRQRVLDRLRPLLIDGGSDEDRYRVIRADRSVIEVDVKAIAIKGTGGSVVRMVATVRDVTIERMAIADREQLLKRLQLATRVASIGLWETRLDDRTEVLDDAVCRLLGLGSGPQLRSADDFLARVHPKDAEFLGHDLQAALESEATTIGPMAFRVVRPDGEVRHVMSHGAIERDANGRARKILGTALDVTDLKRAEQSARLVAERLEVATSLGGLGVFERDGEDRFVYYDGVVSSLWSVDEMRAPSVRLDPLHPVLPEDRPVLAAARLRMMSVDEPVRCEYRVALTDGSVREVLSWRRRRLDAQGEYKGEIGALLDITDLRQAQRRAQEFSTRLAIATSSAGMGVWELDLARCEVTADQNAHAVFGGELLPSPTPYPALSALIDAAERERLGMAITSLPDRAVDLEFRVRLPAGDRTVAIRGEVHRDADGRAERVVGVVWDVTDRRAAERAALETSERLQLATGAAGIGCWQRVLPSGTDQWDEQMYRLCDALADDATPGEILARCMHPEDLPRYDAALEQAATQDTFSCEFRVRRRDGDWRWITARGKVRVPASGPRELLAVAWDVTQSREAEAALLAKEAAERASRAKSEFLSRMSHELRTPLNAIVGFTQLLELDPGDPMSATQRERVGLIRNAGWHLLKLINDVLDLARIESGRTSVAMEVVAWRSVLDDAIAMVQADATQRGIVLETRYAGDVPDTVWADPVRLRQVLLNLLSNAVNYNRDNGSVQVNVRADQDHLVFAVRDAGRGMNASQLARLFQPFNRLGVDSNAPGSGIGLAISQRLVQQMDGTIEVDSEVGVGSEFRVRLRCARIQKRQPSAVTGPTTMRLSMREDVSGTLLYIEDNPANSALVEQFLQFRPNVKLYQAADGATGLVMAAVCQPDLILIDIRLPDMMGDEVLQQLRRQPETRTLTCVAVSANAMPHDIDAALAAGFADYWTKPLEVTRFLRGIDEQLAATTAAHSAPGGEVA